jgi:hypothetical protein
LRPFKTSNVVLTATTLAHPSQQSIGNGATLAQRSGARSNAVMTPFAENLSTRTSPIS